MKAPTMSFTAWLLGMLEGKGFPSDAHFIEQYPIIDTNNISQFVVIYSLENIYFCRKFIFLRLYVNIMKIALTTGIVLLATAIILCSLTNA
jgi:hypothetical protein